METSMNSNSATGSTVSDWNGFFRGFKIDMTMSISHRIAFLLDWAAKKNPYAIIPYNIILKYIMGFSHTPRMANEDVDTLRRKLPGCRPILQKKYKRDIRNVSGVGARATVDDLDLVKSSLPGNVRRVNSAHAALQKNSEMVNIAKLPDHGPDKQWRDWYAKTVSPALKALSDDPRVAKLLPPAPAKPEDGELK
jgi:hypothetical protein